MVAFLAIGSFEPGRAGGGLAGMVGITGDRYPVVYAIRVAATLLLLAWAWPGLRGWLGRPTWWPPLLGLALVVPWVILARLQHDAGWLLGGTERAGFDPFLWYGANSRLAWVYLAVRGLGLVVLVPIIEELFLRGFLMRFVIREDFWKVPFGTVTAAAAGACAVWAVAGHPAEAVAAVGWFAMVTGIAAATRKPIDCILAHAATNLALGVYVVASGNWWLM
jgi:CAAX prenyl protease-like protein